MNKERKILQTSSVQRYHGITAQEKNPFLQDASESSQIPHVELDLSPSVSLAFVFNAAEKVMGLVFWSKVIIVVSKDFYMNR